MLKELSICYFHYNSLFNICILPYISIVNKNKAILVDCMEKSNKKCYNLSLELIESFSTLSAALEKVPQARNSFLCKNEKSILALSIYTLKDFLLH